VGVEAVAGMNWAMAMLPLAVRVGYAFETSERRSRSLGAQLVRAASLIRKGHAGAPTFATELCAGRNTRSKEDLPQPEGPSLRGFAGRDLEITPREPDVHPKM